MLFVFALVLIQCVQNSPFEPKADDGDDVAMVYIAYFLFVATGVVAVGLFIVFPAVIICYSCSCCCFRQPPLPPVVGVPSSNQHIYVLHSYQPLQSYEDSASNSAYDQLPPPVTIDKQSESTLPTIASNPIDSVGTPDSNDSLLADKI